MLSNLFKTLEKIMWFKEYFAFHFVLLVKNRCVQQSDALFK